MTNSDKAEESKLFLRFFKVDGERLGDLTQSSCIASFDPCCFLSICQDVILIQPESLRHGAHVQRKWCPTWHFFYTALSAYGSHGLFPHLPGVHTVSVWAETKNKTFNQIIYWYEIKLIKSGLCIGSTLQEHKWCVELLLWLSSHKSYVPRRRYTCPVWGRGQQGEKWLLPVTGPSQD